MSACAFSYGELVWSGCTGKGEDFQYLRRIKFLSNLCGSTFQKERSKKKRERAEGRKKGGEEWREGELISFQTYLLFW